MNVSRIYLFAMLLFAATFSSVADESASVTEQLTNFPLTYDDRTMVSNDGRFILFRSYRNAEFNLPDLEGGHPNTTHLYDIQAQTVKRVSVSADGESYANNNDISAFFWAEDTKVVFSSRATNLVDDETNTYGIRLFVFDIDEETTARFPLPDNAGEIVSHVVVSKNQQYLAARFDDELYRFSAANETWEEINTADFGGISIISIADNGAILVSDNSNWRQPDIFYVPIDEPAFLLVNSERYAQTHMSQDGLTVFHKKENENFLQSLKISEDTVTREKIQAPSVIASISTFDSRAINQDGSLLSLRGSTPPRIAGDENRHSSTEIFIWKVTDGKAHTLADLKDIHPDSMRLLGFDGDGDTLYFMFDQHVFAYTYSSELVYETDEVDSVTVTSNSPLKAHVSVESIASRFLIERVNSNGDIDIFTASSSSFEDYQYGLTEGEQTYTVFPCNIYWYCGEDGYSSASVDVESFQQPPPLTATTDWNDGNPNIKTSVSLPENATDAYLTRLPGGSHRFDSELTLNQSFNPEFLTYQYCVRNFLNSLTCGPSSELQSFLTEFDFNSMQLILTADLERLRVSWTGSADYTYQLFKSFDQAELGEELNLGDNTNYHLDDNIEYGIWTYYTLKVCSESFCGFYRKNISPKRERHPLTLDAQYLENEHWAKLNISAWYHFDEFKVYRLDPVGNRNYYTLLTTLNGETTEYIDTEFPMRSHSVEYKVEGCVDGNCEYESTRSLGYSLPSPETASLSIENFSVNQSDYLGAILISWDYVNGVDYEVLIRNTSTGYLSDQLSVQNGI